MNLFRRDADGGGAVGGVMTTELATAIGEFQHDPGDPAAGVDPETVLRAVIPTAEP